LRGTWPVGLEMRTVLILKGTLLLLALLECSTHGTAQTDPLKHHQKLCNFNRDCMNEVNCFTPKSMRGHECPFKDRTGKCFKGVCRKSWPCNRKCGNGGTCQQDLRCNLFGCSSKVVCKTCGQKGGRKLNFYDGQCKPAVQPAVQRSPNDCNWCEWERVGGQCGSKRTRKPNCPTKKGQGADCIGESEQDLTKNGRKRTKYFRNEKPETNKFYLECKGGCINIQKVVHDCASNQSRDSRPDELKLVQDLCQDKESCELTPAPSFFGHRGCNGIKKTWLEWNCYNHEQEYQRMIDG